MKYSIILRSVLTTVMFCLIGAVAFAQDEIVIDKQEVGSWFERNWMWVAGGVVLLLILALAGRGSRGRSKSTTTVVKDNMGNVKEVTRTEVRD